MEFFFCTRKLRSLFSRGERGREGAKALRISKKSNDCKRYLVAVMKKISIGGVDCAVELLQSPKLL